MKLSKDFIRRDICGEALLIPVGVKTKEFNGIFTLTETGGFIWDLIPDAETPEDIIDAVTKEFEIARETAQTDVCEFLNKLREYGALIDK